MPSENGMWRLFQYFFVLRLFDPQTWLALTQSGSLPTIFTKRQAHYATMTQCYYIFYLLKCHTYQYRAFHPAMHYGIVYDVFLRLKLLRLM